jgi:anti-sigma28 factor (negative regulator of flagellin synthesis)
VREAADEEVEVSKSVAERRGAEVLEIAMKVHDPNVRSNSAYGPQKTEALDSAQSGRTRGSKPGEAAADQLEISSVAGMLAAEAAGRAARVEQLREAVAAGTYRADAAAVSEKIVADALEKE